MLRSAALMLRYAFGREQEAAALEDAVERALARHPTPDLGGRATTEELTEAVRRELTETAADRSL
jgi:3-isopropylmalate dehydrogenase